MRSNSPSAATAELRKRILERNPVTTGYRISYLANFFVGPVYAEIARVAGLARSEFVVLYCLENLGELSAQDICQITGRPKNSISQAVSKLVGAGHITKRADPSDARRAHLNLTARGRKTCRALTPLLQRREEAMLSVLTERERETFERLLGKLVFRQDQWETAAVGSDEEGADL